MRSITIALFGAAFSAASFAGLLNNPSFELPRLNPNSFLNGQITNWSGPTAQPYYFGLSSQASVLPPIPAGSQVAFVNNFGGDGAPTSYGVAQRLSINLEANVAYILSASFGWRTDNAESRGTLELWSGGTVSEGAVTGGTLLASKQVTLIKGQFVRETLRFLSVPPWDHLGEKLTVRLAGTPLASGFAQINFDDVQLLAEKMQPCQADITRDGAVDDADFSIFALQYNNLFCSTEPDPQALPYFCSADLNFDGVVDDSDFSLFVVAYNDLICPGVSPHIIPVQQDRYVSAVVFPNSDFAKAPGFEPFSSSLDVSWNLSQARASQDSTLGQFGFEVSHSAHTSGIDIPAADSHFKFVFDLDQRAESWLLTSMISGSVVTGSFVGPGVNISLATSGQVIGYLPAGRYTVTSHCASGSGGSANAAINFTIFH
ncbi:MAG: hypothetical protein U0573_13850 [Phycisphaerales bacterium]|nr:hypothetical protein [Planctomycetota bacterium]